MKKNCLILIISLLVVSNILGQASFVGMGWAQNSVNSPVFRKNALVSHKNLQYTAFYDSSGHVILAQRKHGTDHWEVEQTPYTGNILDAHCSISIMIDGDGFLHMAWGHHNDTLKYCTGTKPGTLELTQIMPMVNRHEDDVTYPEFFTLPNGDLVFMYRYGISGRGNLVMNKYRVKEKKWIRLHDVLIDGENQRNAYWQSCVDKNGTIHVSWVWRETWDVSTNHDMCYAKSTDGGISWEKSTGKKYTLPITAVTAEYICEIPQNSELINQTSMSADENGNPYIASYWTPPGSDVPQYHMIYYSGKTWQTSQVSARTTPFSLSGGGTKKIPISRPQIMVKGSGENTTVYYLFRDQERGSKVSIGTSQKSDFGKWEISDITDFSVSSWEPNFDTEWWAKKKKLHVFVQNMGQGDGENLEGLAAQPVYVIEVNEENLKPEVVVVE